MWRGGGRRRPGRRLAPLRPLHCPPAGGGRPSRPPRPGRVSWRTACATRTSRACETPRGWPGCPPKDARRGRGCGPRPAGCWHRRNARNSQPTGKQKVAEARQRLAFGELCIRKGRFALAARFYQECWPNGPTCKRSLATTAACAAVQACTGPSGASARQGVPGVEAAGADLAAGRPAPYGPPAGGGRPSRPPRPAQSLVHCLRDRDFEGVRDAERLAGLPAESARGVGGAVGRGPPAAGTGATREIASPPGSAAGSSTASICGCRAILTRWKSLVRIQQCPFSLKAKDPLPLQWGEGSPLHLPPVP